MGSVTGSVAYVLFCLVAALGYGVLATSYSQRQPYGTGLVILGVLGAPLLLGLFCWPFPHCWQPSGSCLTPDHSNR